MSPISNGAMDTIRKDMSISHADFRRILAGAFGEAVTEQGGNALTVQLDDGRLDIRLGPERERALGLIRLPYCIVDLTFVGIAPDTAAQILVRFERAFQRGGG